ncbi:MAG: glutamyl-tRNA reductase [Armatimonadota bacterium]
MAAFAQAQIGVTGHSLGEISFLEASEHHPLLVTVGLNFRTATLGVREKIAFNSTDIPLLLRDMAAQPGVEEALVLSTCNRTELYAVVHPDLDWATMLRELIARNTSATTAELEESLDQFSGEEAARHLFRVAAGLESMILGEAEIVHQLKKAAEIAREEETTGTILHRLVDKALAASKRARTQVRYDGCGSSVASTAVCACKSIFPDLSKLSVMVLGAGETAELTLHYLVSKGVRRVTIANRTFERAERLARLTGGVAVTLADFPCRLHHADVIISCTASQSPIVTVPMITAVQQARGHRELLIVDLAVPRDVEPDVDGIPGVQLLNVDSLQGSAPDLVGKRRQKMREAERIVDEEAREFGKWLSSRRAISIITSLQQRIEQLRTEVATNLAVELSAVSPVDPQQIDRLTRALVSGVLREAIGAMKQFTGADDGSFQMETAHHILDLWESGSPTGHHLKHPVTAKEKRRHHCHRGTL